MSVFESMSYDHHQDVIFHHDPASGLKAIIAIHNDRLGPAMGGCRMYPYANSREALEDVLRLSRGMSLKSALAGLPYGGGKAVIIGEPRRDKSRELLLAMAEFVNSLAGRYYTAEDSGMGVADLAVMAEKTAYLVGVNAEAEHGGDPSPATALGVFCGIKAALQYRFGSDALAGRCVAIQGAGAVGLQLLGMLKAEGARVLIADVNLARLELAVQQGAELVEPAAVLSAEVDVLAPCAMGAVFDDDSIAQLRAAIIAGSANNQLLRPEHGEQLRRRGILYAPDFVINAGGIIDIYHQAQHSSRQQRDAHIAGIADSLMEIFLRAEAEGQSCQAIAEEMALESLEATAKNNKIRLALT